jgi:hypothetical protein
MVLPKCTGLPLKAYIHLLIKSPNPLDTLLYTQLSFGHLQLMPVSGILDHLFGRFDVAPRDGRLGLMLLGRRLKLRSLVIFWVLNETAVPRDRSHTKLMMSAC